MNETPYSDEKSISSPVLPVYHLNGDITWGKGNLTHREDGPAVILKDGTRLRTH